MHNRIGKSGVIIQPRIKNIHWLLVLIVVFMSGCATHVSKPDGPPHYHVNTDHIPNATPKVEPLSKYGNQPYKVFGKRYYVLNSSKNYHEYGIASWYGIKFHQRHTSSGERYDMLAMTAAHKSLPLPTYVEVTNLSNGRKVIVKVNDRGPFENNRLIDLSYAAAKKLGVVGPGTARVEVKAIDPRDYQRRLNTGHGIFFARHNTPSTVHLASNTKFHKSVYIQVGAFKNKSNAEKLRRQLVAVVASPVEITHHSPRGNLYRVQIGPIKDPMTVALIDRQLKSIGLNSRKMIG